MHLVDHVLVTFGTMITIPQHKKIIGKNEGSKTSNTNEKGSQLDRKWRTKIMQNAPNMLNGTFWWTIKPTFAPSISWTKCERDKPIQQQYWPWLCLNQYCCLKSIQLHITLITGPYLYSMCFMVWIFQNYQKDAQTCKLCVQNIIIIKLYSILCLWYLFWPLGSEIPQEVYNKVNITFCFVQYHFFYCTLKNYIA